MERLLIDVTDIPNTIILGVEGENEVLEIAFDYSDWVEEYGEGVLTLIFKRPIDEGGYPINLIQEDNPIWRISSTDLAYNGWGAGQLRYVVDGAIKKSENFRAYINSSLDESDPPSPYESWVDDVQRLTDEAETYAEVAEEKANEAYEYTEESYRVLEEMRNSVLNSTYSNGVVTLTISEVE